MSYVVNKEKIRGVKIGNKKFKTFVEGETLPSDYTPPSDYILSGLVVSKKDKLNLHSVNKNAEKFNSLIEEKKDKNIGGNK